MPKGDHPLDPRGLIMEAYRIEGITPQDCRTIFFDWAMGLDADQDSRSAVLVLRDHYGPKNPDHPMTRVLEEDTASKPASRRTRRRRTQR
ncbi:hypothetical protein [Algicella marina]|uniref:Uncharacterized protein n=1 Tax=Algicella marina TaxID=2683284 RepID=A0A6P1SVL9_9RHOB|nr:hypothetical protein [Algicella marina]QHQ34498.1 hypothetical protein GO499_04495 [Algicella marina]